MANVKGEVIARIEQFEKGYSSPSDGRQAQAHRLGLEGNVEVTDKVKAAATYSEERVDDGQHDRRCKAKMQARFNEHVTVEPYGKYTEKKLADTATTGEQGKRGDAGVKLIYAWDDDNEAYAFGQGTVKRTGTHGQGPSRWCWWQEAVDGKSHRPQAKFQPARLASVPQAMLSYEPTADDRYYLGYELDPARDTADSWPFTLVGSDVGTIVAGARHRFNEQWSALLEDNLDLFGKHTSLTQVYGVTYTPDAAWTVNRWRRIRRRV